MLNKFGNFHEKIVKLYVKQILIALNTLHERNLVHGNLKCSNILVGSRGIVKLTDAFITPKISWLPQHAKEPNKQTDIFAVGCITIEMLKGI